MLYVPAEPQHKWLSGTSFTTNPFLESNSFGACCDFLSMLQRTGGVIGDHDVAVLRSTACSSRPARYSVMSFASARDPRGRASEIAVLAQHVAIVLDDGSAARRRHQDGVEPALFRPPPASRDVGARARQRVVVAPDVMGQRAAALLVLDQHDLDAVPGQHIDGGLVDARRQHLLGAALQQRDAPAPLARAAKHAAGRGSRRRQAPRRQRQHRLDPAAVKSA